MSATIEKLNETLKGVLEEFVDEIEKNDPLYHTLMKADDDSESIIQGSKKSKG